MMTTILCVPSLPHTEGSAVVAEMCEVRFEDLILNGDLWATIMLQQGSEWIEILVSFICGDKSIIFVEMEV